MPASAQPPVRGLPAVYFNDPAIFHRAKEEVFFRTWQYACHASQLPAPGDYLTFTLFDQDIVVLRDRGDTLRAFYNVCQHRGHRLLEGSGNRRLLVCPYHAWSYGLDGRLKGAPGSDAVDGFDPGEICIPSIRLEEFLGFVFVNLDDGAPSMDRCYPGVREAILALCPDIRERSLADEHSTEEGCNWLVAVENYNECYHCKGAHPDFAEGVIDPASYGVLPFGDGKVLVHSSRPARGDGAWYDVSGSDYGSFYLWPATSIQIYPGCVVNNYHWRPLAVDGTRVCRSWFSRNGQVDDVLRQVIELDRNTTFAEDLVLLRNVQRGIRSRGYRPGPLIISPDGGIDNELSIACLHRWLREAVDGNSSPTRAPT
ncbi:MAG: aromatic ring-hydroxylating dioxygenase subunit alpha [Gammaproteobacteria bacterium]|nr:aromatic ring-hydroxylating dioxygenase subunit alpha [Gammaproteobacteria bacterium]